MIINGTHVNNGIHVNNENDNENDYDSAEEDILEENGIRGVTTGIFEEDNILKLIKQTEKATPLVAVKPLATPVNPVEPLATPVNPVEPLVTVEPLEPKSELAKLNNEDLLQLKLFVTTTKTRSDIVDVLEFLEIKYSCEFNKLKKI